MVVSVIPLPIGNALRILLDPPDGAVLWNLLRNTTGVFTDENDPASVLVAQTVQTTIYDFEGLLNGTLYFYQAFYWDGEEWTADTSNSGTPAATYFDGSTDALTLLQQRLESGMTNEVAMANLIPGQNANGMIAVQTAPPLFEQTQLPLVVVHLATESPVDRGIGELIAEDAQDVDGRWEMTEGWLAKTSITVTGWALNPDVRIALRKALRRLVIGNLQVFAAAGLRDVEFSQSDLDDPNGAEYGCPMYWTVGTFNCLSPIIVGGKVDAISSVTVTVNAETADVIPVIDKVLYGPSLQ